MMATRSILLRPQYHPRRRCGGYWIPTTASFNNKAVDVDVEGVGTRSRTSQSSASSSASVSPPGSISYYNCSSIVFGSGSNQQSRRNLMMVMPSSLSSSTSSSSSSARRFFHYQLKCSESTIYVCHGRYCNSTGTEKATTRKETSRWMSSSTSSPSSSSSSSSSGSGSISESGVDVDKSSTTSNNNDDTRASAIDQSNGGNQNQDQQQQQHPSNLSLPDRDKELALAALQSTITEHYQRGEFGSALEVSKDLMRQTEQHFGKEHPATASAYNNVGLMHKLLGDFVEARSHYNVAMRIYANVVGRDHASYAMTLHNLGSLNKSQIHFDTTLKATERLSLVENALEYLEEALEVRMAELGPEHPHTVATKSAIGSTLAAQVLHQHKMVVSSAEASTTTSAEAAKAAARKKSTDTGSSSSGSNDNKASNTDGRRHENLILPPASTSSSSSTTIDHVCSDADGESFPERTPSNHSGQQHQQQRQYISLNPDDITQAQWKAAEEHLREALQISIDNPRGKRINSGAGGGGGAKKNQKKKGGKKKHRQQQQSTNNSGGRIETLSAASAGQNLAVFLKSMATTSNPYDTTKLEEAKELYEQVQRVRSKLLPSSSRGGGGGGGLHPDLYATKFSYAELLEVMGDEETANAIRQEILDTYEPGSSSNSSPIDDEKDGPTTKKEVVIEKTKASP